MNEEIRLFDFAGENRAYAPQVTEGEGSRRVEGYAIVFNQRSRVMYDPAKKKSFIEIIEPRAVTRELLDSCDIKFLFNHDKNHMLGRSSFGQGTLSYEIDEYGVRFALDLPKSPDGDNVLELIRRGDISGCSFGFQYDKTGFTDAKINGENVRTIIQFSKIVDFSVVVDPAYWGAMVSQRAFEDMEPGKDSQIAGFPAALDEELIRLKTF